MDAAPVFHPPKSKYWVFTTDLLIPLSVIIFILASAYLLLASPLFRIRDIDCQLDFVPCDNPVLLAELSRLQGQNILRFNEQSFGKRLTSAIFTIRQVEIRKTLPSTLSFQLHSVYPVVAIQLQGQSEWVVFDNQLRVIRALSTNPNVPTVIVTEPFSLTVGVPLDNENLTHSLILAQAINTELKGVSAIRLVDNQTLELDVTSGLRAILNPSGDTRAQLESLRAILADATITAKGGVIDMRFLQPVLR